MKCESCEVQIDPKWKNAIEKNECPFCGECIMDNNLKDLLLSAKEIFDELMEENYKDAFIDWIKANYNFVLFKNKNVELESNKPDQSQGEEKKVQGPRSVDYFLNIAKKQNLVSNKEDRIQGAMSKISASAGGESGSLSIEAQIRQDNPGIKPLSINEIDQFASMIGGVDPSGDEDIPQVVLDMASIAKNNPKDYNTKDVHFLQNQFNKQRDASEAMYSKGNGKFSRG